MFRMHKPIYKCQIIQSGWPRTLENRENCEKKFPAGKNQGILNFAENQGISKNLIFVRSKYSNFIAVQMWLLVVSFFHMLKIPADLILLKGGVLVCCIFCFFFFSF